MNDLKLIPRDPRKPYTLDELKSYFSEDYLIHDFNSKAHETVSEWFSELNCKTPKPLVVRGKCGYGKTHLIFHHLKSFLEANQNITIYWWQAERFINMNFNLGKLQMPGIIFFETVLDQEVFKSATEIVVKRCKELNFPLILSDASGSFNQNLEMVDYVEITEPSPDFYKLFSDNFKRRNSEVKFRSFYDFKSIRHLEHELRRDVLAHEMGIELK